MLQGSWESLVEVEPMPAPPAAPGRRLAVAAGALLALEWPGSPRSQPVCVGVARESLVGVEPTLAPPAVPRSRWLLEAPACAGMAGTGAAEFAALAPRLRWGRRGRWGRHPRRDGRERSAGVGRRELRESPASGFARIREHAG